MYIDNKILKFYSQSKTKTKDIVAKKSDISLTGSGRSDSRHSRLTEITISLTVIDTVW